MNDITITNRFTVECAGKLSTGHNTLLDIVTPLSLGKKFTRYLAVGKGGALNGKALSSQLAVKETELVEFNSDPSRGETYAVYSVCLTSADLADGSVVSEIGLSGYEDGAELINYAILAKPVEKKSGHDLYIRAELRLTMTSDYACFTAGDNGLVRALLGMDDFASASFYIGQGNNYHPNVVIPRSTDSVYKWHAASVTASDGVIEFKASCKYSLYELVLKMNDKPVLRAFYANGTYVKTATSPIRRDRSFEIRFEHVLALNSVKYSGKAVSEYYAQPLYRYVTASSCPQIIPYKLKKNARITSDFTSTYMSVGTDKELTVYTLVGSEPVALYKAAFSPSVHRVASDGSIFAGGSVLKALVFDGENVTEKNYSAYTNVTEIEVLVYNGAYWVAMLTDGNFVIAMLDGDSATEYVRINDVPSDFGFYHYGYYAFNYWSVSGDVYGTRGPFGEIESTTAALKKALTTENREILGVYGRYVHYYDAAQKKSYLCAYEHPTMRELNATYEIERVGDLILVWSSDGKLYKVGSYYANNMMPLFLEGTYAVDRGTSAALLGNYLLIAYPDGSVKTIYLSQYGLIVNCPELSSGSVTHEAVYLTAPRPSNSHVAHHTIKFTIGGNE